MLMFIAFVFPLSDRSGLNLIGSFNTKNLTEYASLSKSSANGDEVAGMDLDDDEDGASTSAKDDSLAEAALRALPPQDQEVYAKFWHLQSFCVAPSTAVQTMGAYKQFKDEIDVVLTAFGAQKAKVAAVVTSDAATAKVDEARDAADGEEDGEVEEDGEEGEGAEGSNTAANNATGSGGAGVSDSEAFSVKYLTSPDLFHLQLTDPALRRHVLLQLLIVFQYLESGVPHKLPRIDLTKDLQSEKRRVFRVLGQTSPDGAAFVASMKKILKDELDWVKWKADKCPSYDKPPMKVSVAKPNRDYVPTPAYMLPCLVRTSESQRMMALHNAYGRLGPAGPALRHGGKYWASQKETPNLFEFLAKDPSAKKPDLETYLKPLRTAMDPDAGIEEAFHPKNDETYVWRGLRLISAKSLDVASNSIQCSLDEVVKKYDISTGAAAAPANGDDNKSGAKAEPVPAATPTSQNGTSAPEDTDMTAAEDTAPKVDSAKAETKSSANGKNGADTDPALRITSPSTPASTPRKTEKTPPAKRVKAADMEEGEEGEEGEEKEAGDKAGDAKTEDKTSNSSSKKASKGKSPRSTPKAATSKAASSKTSTPKAATPKPSTEAPSANTPAESAAAAPAVTPAPARRKLKRKGTPGDVASPVPASPAAGGTRKKIKQ